MEITLNGTKVTYVSDKVLGYKGNNLVNEIKVNVNDDNTYSYKLWVLKKQDNHCGITEVTEAYNLNRVGNVCTLPLTSDFLNTSGKYTMQIEAISGDTHRHSSLFVGQVKNTLF